MLIKTLKINNLRNISTAEIEAIPGLNVFIGDNGAGKTTVLEALLILAKGRSFRTGQIASLIGPDSDQIRVVATIAGQEKRDITLGIERSVQDWRARQDGESLKQLSDLAEFLPLVLMEPNSHLLVSGPPEGRRRYLDWGVFHVEHRFLSTWRRYARAVKQRNAALRAKDMRTAQSLDPLVTDLGEQIHESRARQVENLLGGLPGQMIALGSALPEIEMRYQKGWAGESLRAALEQSEQRDFERGSTGPGPHRADLFFQTGQRPARDSLSRGEQKLLAAALLLVQAGAISATGVNPVLLLDDLASEFDSHHRGNVLAASLKAGAQVWLTGTRFEPEFSLQGVDTRVFHVEHGQISVKTDG